jgi:hypothetical protein
MWVDIQAYSRPGLLSEHPQDSFGRRSENLDTRGGLQRLGVGLAGTVTDDVQMKFEGGSVRMYLDDCHLAAFLIDVLVERDQPRLTGLDEARQRRDALLLGVESAVPEPVGAVKMNGPGMRLLRLCSSSCLSAVLAGAIR